MGRGGPGGWIILDEPELPNVKWFELAPDWVCEVASPSTELFDRAEKLPVYARAGVKHVWIVNPVEKFLEVLRLESGAWMVVGTFNAPTVRALPLRRDRARARRAVGALTPF